MPKTQRLRPSRAAMITPLHRWRYVRYTFGAGGGVTRNHIDPRRPESRLFFIRRKTYLNRNR